MAKFVLIKSMTSQRMSLFDKIFNKKKESEQKNICKSQLPIPDFDKYNEFEQIVFIFDYVLNPDFEVANKAAQTILRLFKTTQNFKHKQLYETFRYLRINKSDIKKFDSFEYETKIVLLCIVSVNGNGYSREEALKRLIEIKDKRSIPFIFYRLSDWVSPIRFLAEQAIKEFIAEGNTVYFIENHKLINWILKIKRNDLSELYNLITNSLTSKRLSYDQIKQLSEGDRFFYFKSIAQTGKLDEGFVDEMINDNYYLIRILLIKHFEQTKNKQSILSKLLSDKSQKVRQGAVNLISELNPENYQQYLENMIFDSSASVRHQARQLLEKSGNYDFKQIYKESLSYNNRHLVGYILGLSEISDKEDICFIQKFLESEQAKVKTATLIGLFNLDPDLAIEKAYQILETNNPISTKKAAESILAKRGVDYYRLRRLYDLLDIPGKKIILRLFNRFSCWSVAGDFLKAMTDENKEIQLMAGVFLQSWERYTVRLATKQNPWDKEYVLSWYDTAKKLNLNIPDYIPFIFGVKQ